MTPHARPAGFSRRWFGLGVLAAGAPFLMASLPVKKTITTGAAACPDPELCSEAQRRALLPHSDDPFWALLKACTVTEDAQTNRYSLTPTASVRAMNGTTVRVKGFTVPLDGTDRTSHFLIAVNTPVCFYHPPGEPNEILEVTSTAPIAWDEKPKTIEGVFAIAAAGDAGVYFRLSQARLIG